VARPHYLCNAEHVSPSLLAALELKFHQLNQWLVKKLRSCVMEVELSLKRSVSVHGKRDSKL